MAEKILFDHYEVLVHEDGTPFELGRGTMGITYRAFDRNLRCEVALKVIAAHFLETEGARERFKSEARAAAKLRHPNVAAVFHLGVDGDSYFYAMEFIDGETVEDLVRRSGALDPALALNIAAQVARALNAAEKHSLVHRDIKPANLMLVRDDDNEFTVKVIDFGLAKSTDPEASSSGAVTIAGFVGTPYYASPEQLQEKSLDSRSDIYSLGMTLWFMLNGSAPFTGTLAEVMTKHLMAELPEAELARFPQPIAQLLKRMVEKDPNERQQSALALRREIEEAIAALTEVGDGAEVPEEEMETMADEEVSFAAQDGNALEARYELIEDVGEGESGHSYQAKDRSTGELLRVVVLNSAIVQDADAYTRLEREVDKVRAVSHPNLLRVLSLEWMAPSGVLAVEWTDGFSLLDVLRARRELEPDGALLLLKQAAEGVDHALSQGLDRLDFALHQVRIHFQTPPDQARKEELLRTPIRDWPTFSVKLNPLGITRDLSMNDTWAGGQTIVGHSVRELVGEPRESGGVGTPSRYVQSLSALLYELLGGSQPPAMLRPGVSPPLERYIPIATISEEGNAVLRQGLDPEASFPSARALLAAIEEVESFQLKRPGTRVGPAKPGTAVGKLPASAPDASSMTAFGTTAGEAQVVPTPPPAPPAPPPIVPRPRGPKPSKVPVIVATAVVLLLLVVAAALAPMLFKKRAQTAESPAIPTPTATPAAIAERTPTPAATAAATPVPVPTPVPIPTPEPTPSRQAELKVAMKVAEAHEAGGNWAEAIDAYVRIGRDFPESDLGRVRLEILLQRFRASSPELTKEQQSRLRKSLEAAAELGVPSAMLEYAELVREENPKATFDWMCAAAALGVKEAYTQVGLIYSNGAGVPRDFEKSVWWFQEAADRGDVPALVCLAECYRDGKGVARDPAKAAGLLKEAVSKGNSRAMDILGTFYHNGIGVQRDYGEAKKLFTNAIKLGNQDALGNLGVLYMNGQGVSRDVAEAVNLFEKGSRGGSSTCMYSYAICLENGIGVQKNRGAAAKWYTKAAKEGHPKAQEWCRKNGFGYE